jgi:hypothetical protein
MGVHEAIIPTVVVLMVPERAKVRELRVRHGHGKESSEEVLRTELVGIEGLTSYDAYGEPEQTRFAHQRDYRVQSLNAVLVRLWNNRAPSARGQST